MKSSKENTNLNYIENPQVEYSEGGYEQSQQRQNYDKKKDSYYEKQESYYEEDKIYDKKEEFFDKEEPYDHDHPYTKEDSLHDMKVKAKAEQFKSFSNPFMVAVFLYIFWPLGLYCIWKYKVYKTPVRIILSIVMPIFGTLRWIARFAG